MTPRRALAEASSVGGVGAAAMEQAAYKEHDGSRGHRGLHGFGAVVRRTVDPPVATGHNASGTVRFGEIVECPHGVDDELLVRALYGEVLITVQSLGRLTGADIDADGRREHELPAENVVEDTLEEWIEGCIIEGSGLGEECVDALGAEPLEVVAAPRYGGKDALEVGLLSGDIAGAAIVLDDGVTVLSKGSGDLFYGGGLWESCVQHLPLPNDMRALCGEGKRLASGCE